MVRCGSVGSACASVTQRHVRRLAGARQLGIPRLGAVMPLQIKTATARTPMLHTESALRRGLLGGLMDMAVRRPLVTPGGWMLDQPEMQDCSLLDALAGGAVATSRHGSPSASGFETLMRWLHSQADDGAGFWCVRDSSLAEPQQAQRHALEITRALSCLLTPTSWPDALESGSSATHGFVVSCVSLHTLLRQSSWDTASPPWARAGVWCVNGRSDRTAKAGANAKLQRREYER
jgi:hypothetical protein